MKKLWPAPAPREFTGQHVRLTACDPANHGDTLYALSHGSPERLAVWQHLPYGPFTSAAELSAWYQQLVAGKTDPLIWTVLDLATSQPVGITGLLAIVPAHGRAEIGHVWFSPTVQRTATNTEAQYLLLKYLFDELQYRRVEWKCDSGNHASRTTATRMGFTFEGRFRQHMIVRGRNRDTDWFAMTDKEWPLRRANFERWLYAGERLSLMELNNG